ncbi:response regulator [Pseudomonas cremoricolorata]|uniref:response regulator n=1 Tax=Pseudomonas cremoricolorata TaxID=157783 RepID=UPI000407F93D|nr:response regulator [Pseudomonas cremoricolorata]
MKRLTVLIHQQHSFHQITLHQACNAQGVFDVRLCDDLRAIPERFEAGRAPDLLMLDQRMPARAGKALLERLGGTRRTPALLFVGQPDSACQDFAHLARQQGLWVVGELDWPLSANGLRMALQRLDGIARPLPLHSRPVAVEYAR